MWKGPVKTKTNCKGAGKQSQVKVISPASLFKLKLFIVIIVCAFVVEAGAPGDEMADEAGAGNETTSLEFILLQPVQQLQQRRWVVLVLQLTLDIVGWVFKS